jgi:membrane protein DedA with SNARE-associated domain
MKTATIIIKILNMNETTLAVVLVCVIISMAACNICYYVCEWLCRRGVMYVYNYRDINENIGSNNEIGENIV